MKAGILELSFSIPILLIVILTSTFAFNVWLKYDRDIGVLSEEGEAIDYFQFLVEKYGYVDPCSGNAYPIFVQSSIGGSSSGLRIVHIASNQSYYLYMFPVLLLLNDRFMIAFLGIGEQDACVLLYR